MFGISYEFKQQVKWLRIFLWGFTIYGRVCIYLIFGAMNCDFSAKLTDLVHLIGLLVQF